MKYIYVYHEQWSCTLHTSWIKCGAHRCRRDTLHDHVGNVDTVSIGMDFPFSFCFLEGQVATLGEIPVGSLRPHLCVMVNTPDGALNLNYVHN